MIALLLIVSAYASDLNGITGNVTFDATVHPGSFKIHGQGGSPSCRVQRTTNALTGECSFDLTTLDTSNQTRNGHMRDKYLETAQHPSAKLTFNQIPCPGSDQPFGGPFNGQLELHGVTKPIAGTLQIKPDGKTVVADVAFDLKLSDHAITQPSFAGIKVDDVVQVRVHASAPKD